MIDVYKLNLNENCTRMSELIVTSIKNNIEGCGSDSAVLRLSK